MGKVVMLKLCGSPRKRRKRKFSFMENIFLRFLGNQTDLRRRKNKKRTLPHPVENSPEQSNEATSVENVNANNPEGVIVLGVYMHCQGCADTIVKYLRGFDGVEQIDPDIDANKVTVKGENADPKKVLERLRKKSNRHVDLISPILKENIEEKKEENNMSPKVVEVVLKIYMHCDSCAEKIKYRIHKMQGVVNVETNMSNSQVTVKGVFEPRELVEYINKRVGKYALIVNEQTLPPVNKEGEKNAEKKEENEWGKIDIKDFYHIFPPGSVYAPQFFSEENPNACSVM